MEPLPSCCVPEGGTEGSLVGGREVKEGVEGRQEVRKEGGKEGRRERGKAGGREVGREDHESHAAVTWQLSTACLPYL